jgi:hypothetical protein
MPDPRLSSRSGERSDRSHDFEIRVIARITGVSSRWASRNNVGLARDLTELAREFEASSAHCYELGGLGEIEEWLS